MRTVGAQAAKAGQVEVLRLLHEDEAARSTLGLATAREGFTPAHFAANFGHSACLHALRELGCCGLHEPDSKGRTPAHLAAMTGREPCLRALALSSAASAASGGSAQLEAVDAAGWAPAHYAARGEHDGSLRALAALGVSAAGFGAQTPGGESVAMLAASKGSLACLRALGGREQGAPATLLLADGEGRTAAFHAVQGLDDAQGAGVLRLLLQLGAARQLPASLEHPAQALPPQFPSTCPRVPRVL